MLFPTCASRSALRTYPVQWSMKTCMEVPGAAKPLQDMVNAANEVIPDNLGKPVSR